MGFPLASFRADVLALWPAEGQERPDKSPGYSAVFEKALILLHGQNHKFFSVTPVQKRWGVWEGVGGVGDSWQQERGRGGTNSLCLTIVPSLGDENQCDLKVILHSKE